jgi:YfiH family protein
VRRHGDSWNAGDGRRDTDEPTARPVTGLHIVGDCDGHTTAEAGLLLAVTAADCVPIFVADPARRRIAVLHVGWRGVGARLLERGFEAIEAGDPPEQLHVHLGPAICGECYEVGPEVFESLGLPRPDRPTRLDLRAVLARRALDVGVSADRITISEHCTRCTRSGLFSHRGGDLGRQVGFLGIRL